MAEASGGGKGLALLHELSERLSASESYLAVARRRADEPATPPGAPATAALLGKAQSQLAEANRLVHRLRRTLAGSQEREIAEPAAPGTGAATAAGNLYRVCFLNHFARGNKTVTACQRAIVIRLAKTRERAVEAAKKRFARLEGVRDWRIRASHFTVQRIDTDAAGSDGGEPTISAGPPHRD